MSKKNLESKKIALRGKPIVLEFGSAFTRIGFSSEDTPRIVKPTIVGYKDVESKNDNLTSILTETNKQAFVGIEAIERRKELETVYPIENRKINDMQALKVMIQYAIERDLSITPDEHAAIVILPYPISDEEKEEITKMLLDDLKFPGVYVSSSENMPLYSIGRTTGLVVDSGYEKTDTIPIINGKIITKAVKSLNIGGYHVTNKLREFMREQDFTYTDEEDKFFGAARNIKENICYVALNSDKELELASKVSGMRKIHKLPNGEKYSVDTPRFLATEILFQPEMIDLKENPLHEQIIDSIQSCDTETQSSLWSNIVIAGGNSILPGYHARLNHELKLLAPENEDVRIHTTPSHSSFSSWIGASILSSRMGFSKHWITKK